MNTWRRIEEKSVVECIPVRGIIELNYSCNFDCMYCYLGDTKKDRTYLSLDRCRDIFAQLRQAGTLTLTFSGGEPFLNPDFPSILRAAREARFGVRIFTNGSLIQAPEIELLKKVKPLSVDVSLYGASEKTYNRITGTHGMFTRVTDALRLLAEAHVHTIIKIVVSRENSEELEKMHALADQYGMTVTASPLITPEDCGDLSPCDHMLPDEELEHYFLKYGKPPRSIQRHDNDIICTSARNSFVISPKGDVFPCIQIRQSAGNICESDFNDIWASSPLLEQIRKLRFSDFKECRECPMSEYCFFCPGLALLESGSLTGKNLTACRFTALRLKARNAHDRNS